MKNTTKQRPVNYKELLVLFIIIWLPVFGNSQDTLFTYFDKNWKECAIEDAVFYRKSYKIKKKQWAVNDYYLNGQLQMSGIYKTKKAKKKVGEFKYYYESGTLESKELYKSNSEKTGEWISYFENSKIDYTGTYKEDLKEGEWRWYFENGQISAKELYKKDELIEITYWDEDGTIVKGDLKISEPPEFPGGLDMISEFLKENLQFPEIPWGQPTSGRVHVKFVVEKDGSMTNIEISKQSIKVFNDEALRVIKLMPDWKPGKFHNRVARIEVTQPIKFTGVYKIF
jgi:TonB family protein